VNSEGPGIVRTVWWENNLCGPGSPLERIAEYIARERPRGNVIEVGGPPVPSIQEYEKCFTKSAKKHGLTIAGATHNTKDTAATAQPLVADLLTKTPDVDAIWAYNDASALGASAALTAKNEKVFDGSNDGVIVFGQNGDADAITAIRDSRLTGTVDPDHVATGWAMIKALSGLVGESKGDSPSGDLVVKSHTWTLDNIGDYKSPRDRHYSLDTVPLAEGSGD
jgi:ribose transport system substrate-binding protein